MKLYGSLQNRLLEGNQFVKEIKVGDGVTEYFYTDRQPYEVIEVKSQKNIVIIQMDCKRIDDNGMSDVQNYEYISNNNNPVCELVLRNNVWYKVTEYNKKTWEECAKRDFEAGFFKTFESAYNYFKAISTLTEKQIQKIENGGSVKKYTKTNISIGFMNKYYDYSF